MCDVSQGQPSLEEIAARYRLLLSVQSDGILIVDAKSWQIIEANDAALGLYGYARADFIGLDIRQLSADKDATALQVERLEAGQPITVHGRLHRRRDGCIFPVDLSSAVEHDNGVRRVCVIVRDVSAAVAAEKALRESEERFRALAESSTMGVVIHHEGPICAANLRVEEMTGYSQEELLKMEVIQLICPTSRGVVEEKIAYNAPFEISLQRKDSTCVFCEVEGREIVYHDRNAQVVTFRDITHRKQAETRCGHVDERLQHQQKLEAIGILAASVAHEINNPVMAIINFSELVRRQAMGCDEDRISQMAEQIGIEAERVGLIVRNLLSFSRQEREAPMLMRMIDVMQGVSSLVNAVVAKDQVTCTVNIPDDLPLVRCHEQQIQQVLMNLVANARDALNERYPNYDEEKTIHIKAREYVDDEGRWVRTSVEDHGAGIPDDLRRDIFDPFFTTKGKGKGTGLGLAVTRSIILEHKGRLLVESEEGAYTRFIVDLPVGKPIEPLGSAA
ncbi:MAG: PAS domain S-box protein [Deltaproteobacteria bacterium]|nr:PAS domain S-box protein [Deltaproteobacteria bacterium]